MRTVGGKSERMVRKIARGWGLRTRLCPIVTAKDSTTQVTLSIVNYRIIRSNGREGRNGRLRTEMQT